MAKAKIQTQCKLCGANMDSRHGPVQLHVCLKQKVLKFREKEFKTVGSLILYPNSFEIGGGSHWLPHFLISPEEKARSARSMGSSTKGFVYHLASFKNCVDTVWWWLTPLIPAFLRQR